MNIGLLVSIPSGDLSLKLSQVLLEMLKSQTDKNVVIFADSYYNSNTNLATMPIGNLNSFTGDLICTTAKDVIKATEIKRDINIKYICSVDINNIEQTFHLDNIEYLAGSSKDKYRAISVTGEDSVRTIEEWINER